MLHRRVLATFLVLVLAAWPAKASDGLRQALSRLAQSILDTIGEGGTVKVGVFALKTSDLQGVNSGPGLEQGLTRELEARRKGVVKPDAPYEVNGDYLFAHPSRDSRAKVVKVKAHITDSSTGEEIQKLSVPTVELADNKSINEILQPTVDLPSGEDQEQRNQRIDDAVTHPRVHIHGPDRTLIATSEKSPFAVEIRVKRAGADTAIPRAARERNGQAYVPVSRGESYEVIVYNHSGREVAVSLSVDGVDNFQFMEKRKSDGQPEFSHWILAKDPQTGKPGEQLRVPGWLSTTEGTNGYLSFLVVGYGAGAASKAAIPARDKVGVIRVGIYETYPLREGQTPKGNDETGIGPPISGNAVEKVTYGIGAELTSIAVRYTRDQK